MTTSISTATLSRSVSLLPLDRCLQDAEPSFVNTRSSRLLDDSEKADKMPRPSPCCTPRPSETQRPESSTYTVRAFHTMSYTLFRLLTCLHVSILIGLQATHVYAKQIVKVITSATGKMPFCIRWIARELLQSLRVSV